MIYFNREEVERIGKAGSYYEVEDGYLKARVLSSFWLYCDPSDEGFTPHMTVKGEGFWESWITVWMSQNVAPGSNCLDIGANMGYYTMFLIDHGCKVRAVEPQPKLAALIEKSAVANGIKWNSWETVDRSAVSDRAGSMTMRVPIGHGMNASIAYEPGSPNGYEEIEVTVYSLNDYVGDDDRYDFIKVDVEGAEDNVFHGADLFIEENPDCVWLLEWRWDRLNDPMRSAREIFEKMHVWHVDHHGNEVALNKPEDLAQRQHEDWMLVLRKR
jgi:FkbM family methyltransferase